MRNLFYYCYYVHVSGKKDDGPGCCHLVVACRSHDNTPARQALKEALRLVNKPQGRPKTTWLKLVRNNLIDA